MKKLLILAAVSEAATGIALIAVPTIVVRFLCGAELIGVGIVIARIYGISLIAIGVACWPSDGAGLALRNADLQYASHALHDRDWDRRLLRDPVVASNLVPRLPHRCFGRSVAKTTKDASHIGSRTASDGHAPMLDKARSRPDMLLLLSLLFVIVMYPVLDHGDMRRLILVVLMFVPILLATVRLSRRKGRVWPASLLAALIVIVSAASTLVPNRVLIGGKWGLLAAFFALTVAGLFPYLRDARSVTDAHLYTAISIYLLLGMAWFALYSAIEVFYPGHFSITPQRRHTVKARCCTSVWSLSRPSATETLSRFTVRSVCWRHSRGSQASSTSRLLWQCWSAPIKRNTTTADLRSALG